MNTYTFGTKLKQLATTQNPRVSMKTRPTGRAIKYWTGKEIWEKPLTDQNIAINRRSIDRSGSAPLFSCSGLRVGLSSFISFVNQQTRQNLASVINSDPQREQNILLLTLHRTLRLRLRLQEEKRWETLRSASRQLVSDITLLLFNLNHM